MAVMIWVYDNRTEALGGAFWEGRRVVPTSAMGGGAISEGGNFVYLSF